MPVFSGGTIAGSILPDATGRNLGALAQLWNAFLQICTFGGSSSGSTQLKASAVASGVLTLPAATDTLVGKATTDTLTNKTLTSPTISGTVFGNPSIPITGVTTNSNAAAGIVGEYAQGVQSTPQSVTTAVILNLTSITLTAGDWDVSGSASFILAGAPATYLRVSISSLNNNVGAAYDGSTTLMQGNGATFNTSNFSTGTLRLSLAGTTTYYLNVDGTFASTMTATGTIRARRVR